MINNKHLVFKRFMNKKGFVNNNSNNSKFSFLENKLSSLSETSKREYFSKIAKKLSDPSISSKTYWSILKSFLTGKKLPCIPGNLHEKKLLLTSEKNLRYSILSLRQSMITD